MDSESVDKLLIEPIGYMNSCFKTKNGTPRQPSISPLSSGYVKIEKTIFTNPEHSLEGLKDFSHVWILFHFHLNENKGIKAKVRPPRMNGSKTGVFSTRSPHRPNPIGLTLAKLVKVDGQTIYLSGIDLVDRTPVLDIKPYIEQYDFPKLDILQTSLRDTTSFSETTKCISHKFETKTEYHDEDLTAANVRNILEDEKSEICKDENLKNGVKASSWVDSVQQTQLNVIFASRAEKDLSAFKSVQSSGQERSKYDLKFFKDCSSLKQAIIDIFMEDPRSTYRRNKCSDRLYYASIDNCHVTAWFDYTTTPVTVEILRIKPLDDMTL